MLGGRVTLPVKKVSVSWLVQHVMSAFDRPEGRRREGSGFEDPEHNLLFFAGDPRVEYIIFIVSRPFELVSRRLSSYLSF